MAAMVIGSPLDCDGQKLYTIGPLYLCLLDAAKRSHGWGWSILHLASWTSEWVESMCSVRTGCSPKKMPFS